jgi:adhesin transport system membrane fusion protein
MAATGVQGDCTVTVAFASGPPFIVTTTRVPREGRCGTSDPARVKITTYNYIRYGVLEGRVMQISPDATKDERTGVLFFSVWVETEKNYLGDQPGRFQVSPGMTAEVDLVIGKRTILAFLTDRLRQTASEAFAE